MDVLAADGYDFSHVVQLLTRNISVFALTTRETHLIPKSTCRSIMNDVYGLFSVFFQQLSQCIVNRLEENGFDIGRDSCLKHMLLDDSFIDSLWSNVHSDANLKRFCREKLGFIEPEAVLFGINETSGKPECYQYVSVCKTVQHYVQHEDVWCSMNRVRCKAENILYDYTDGTAFQQHTFFAMHPDALRIHLYVDDLELCTVIHWAVLKRSTPSLQYITK